MSAARVLVVDDEPGVLALCERLLTKAGYRAALAASADAGLAALETAPFDLLLLDIRMPDMDGFTMIHRARELQPELAIVIMTGFGTVETAVRALEEGAAGLVLKPFESNQAMLRQVRVALESTRARREAARSRVLQPLFDLAETLLSETEESSLAQRVLAAVRGQMACQRALILLQEQGAEGVRALGSPGPASAAAGEAPAWSGPFPAGLERYTARRPGPRGVQAWMTRHGLGEALAVPVRRAQVSYMVLAARPDGEPPFSESEQELLVLLGRLAGVALDNARLYGSLRAYVKEIERSQQQLVQSEKLAAIGRLTATIAHEVNNPLQSLRNCLDLIGRAEGEGERARAYLGLARKELDRLSWIMRQMLEFYRPEAANRQQVDLNRMLREVIQLTAGQCEQRRVEVALELEEPLPRVWGVGFQLQQVALNLVLNALEAMPAGGRLTVRTRLRRQRVTVMVRDTGRGISREELGRIFEPFYTSKEGGTGLGLAISYGIVAAHGGAIEVESDPGAGSTFYVLLPPAAKE